ncbi:MAG: hypothetical protein H7Y86_11795 [Rhizobacter sp.]|nr:hypothetical protein [Ferruginibacter sp.]
MQLLKNLLFFFRVNLSAPYYHSGIKKSTILFLFAFILSLAYAFKNQDETQSSRICVNQLGYLPGSKKAAVWGSKDSTNISSWQLIDAQTKKIATSGKAGKAFSPCSLCNTPISLWLKKNYNFFNPFVAALSVSIILIA